MEKTQVNSAGQRIWLIETPDDYDLNSVPADDIDAILIDLPQQLTSYTIDLVVKIRAYRVNKLYLKPLFTTMPEDLIPDTTKELIDGFEPSINRTSLIDKTKEINQIVNRYVELSLGGFAQHLAYTIQLLRYNFARKKDLIYSLSEQSLIGYNRPLLLLSMPTGEQVIAVLDELARIAKEGYLNQKFHDKLHLCPQCQSVHLIYRERCTKCASANLTSQPVIHHFRCSHVGPESDFVDGEKLVCPKCHKHLRHLGVDYDKPSIVNTCETCGFSSQSSDLAAQCLHCKKTTLVEELHSFTLYGYFYNDRTIDYVINPVSPFLLIENLLQGVLPFQDFALQVEQEIIKFETTNVKPATQKNNLYLAVYAFEFEIRYADTKRRVDKNLYVDIMQSVVNMLLSFRSELNTDHLKLTFHNNKHMVFIDLLMMQQANLKSEDGLVRLKEMISQKYGSSIEVEAHVKHCKYKKNTNSILAFIREVETL